MTDLSSLPPIPTDLSAQLLTVAVIILQRTINHNRITTRQPIRQNYDFIVVGSGTSGATLAGRLTENPNVSVLVLETGGPQTVTSDVPSHARQQFGTDMDWGYRTTSQTPYAGNAYGGHVAIPRGRIVGGSHNMNFMVYSRGNRRDYDSWPAKFGATGWSYNEVLPYFLRSENQTDLNILAYSPMLHSTRGPVVVRSPLNPDPIIAILKDSVITRGFPLTDQNGPNQLGIGYMQQTIYLNATRATTASVFLEANIGRPNLQVLTRAFVTRVLFNSTNAPLRAIGVEYEHEGQVKRVYATREVLLCAGSINTPQLLMLSGVGPRDHLTQLGIQTLVDLPVGHHLKDHAFVQLDFEVLDPNMVTTGIDWNLANMYRYFVNYDGPLAHFPLTFMYFNTPYNNETDWPDIQIDFNMAPLVNDLEAIVANYDQSQRDAWRDYYRPHVGDPNRMGMLCFHFRPHSVGRVYLNSTNPHDYALLDTRYLTDPYDIAALMEVIRRGLQLSHQPPFNRLLRMYKQPIPGCQLCPTGPIWECNSYIECYARAVTMTVGHQVGTCKMGSGPDTVVDPRMRVRGIDRLRVVDGSIFPDITNGATNAPCMMFGEYGADMIRQDNNLM